VLQGHFVGFWAGSVKDADLFCELSVIIVVGLEHLGQADAHDVVLFMIIVSFALLLQDVVDLALSHLGDQAARALSLSLNQGKESLSGPNIVWLSPQLNHEGLLDLTPQILGELLFALFHHPLGLREFDMDVLGAEVFESVQDLCWRGKQHLVILEDLQLLEARVFVRLLKLVEFPLERDSLVVLPPHGLLHQLLTPWPIDMLLKLLEKLEALLLMISRNALQQAVNLVLNHFVLTTRLFCSIYLFSSSWLR
jgi:hypothetical protein